MSQEEVAFLLGVSGARKDVKVSRDEQAARIPTLETALAYQVIYGKPIDRLFAGLYEGVAKKIAERARILGHRKDISGDKLKSQVLTNLRHQAPALAI